MNSSKIIKIKNILIIFELLSYFIYIIDLFI